MVAVSSSAWAVITASMILLGTSKVYPVVFSLSKPLIVSPLTFKSLK